MKYWTENMVFLGSHERFSWKYVFLGSHETLNWKCGLFRIIWNIELTVCPFYYPQTTLGNLTMCILAKGLFHLVSRNADTFWSSVQVRDILETLLINQGQLKSIMFLYLVSVMLTSVICTSCIAPSPLTIAILVTLVQLVFSLS